MIKLRECTMCGRILPLEQFNRKGYHPNGDIKMSTECKDCLNGRSKVRLDANRDLIKRNRTPCTKCGEERWYVIEFHHRDPNAKEFTIGHSACRSHVVLEREIGKCDTLCKNCHKEFHYLERTFNVSYDEYIDDDFNLDAIIKDQ